MHRSLVPEHWAVAMRLALIGFMATSWFLSRSLPDSYVSNCRTGHGYDRAPEAPPLQSRSRNRWVFSALASGGGGDHGHIRSRSSFGIDSTSTRIPA